MSFVAATSTIAILLISKYWHGRGTNERVHLVMAVLSFIVLFNVIINTMVDPQIERSIFFIAYFITVSLFAFIFEFPPESIKFWNWLMFIGLAVSIMLNDQRQRAVLRSATEEMQLECQFFESSFSGQGVEVALLERPIMPKYFDALQENRIISAVDAVTDKRTLELADYLKEKFIVSMLAGPIVVRG